MSLSQSDILAIGILLDADAEEERREEAESPEVEREHSQRQHWVHPLWKTRAAEGEFATLFKGLIDHEEKFFEYFRMPRAGFAILFQKLEQQLRKKDTNWRNSISAEERLAVCLRFLATGDSHKTISFSYRLGHTTVNKIVNETCAVIVRTLLHEMIPEPTNDTWTTTAEDFWTKWNFPNCIGALDGKHVVIQAPPNSGSQYYNYKKTFSIVLLALVDANYKFLAVDVGGYGKNSDGGIFAHSAMGRRLEAGTLNVPDSRELPGSEMRASHVIVGDEAFPLKTYLLRPYPGVQLSHDTRIFNYRLSRARRVVENAFGILAQKFRIYHRRLNANPENADNIILSTCILHNFIRDLTNDQPTGVPHGASTSSEIEQTSLENLPNQGGQGGREALLMRDTFKEYFLSEAGSVPWQEELA
ncbi:protein ALP1-like [Ceratina calcarata]|uniref:Protein ALP1-like n=1 Tax=Ceratina calcarata TaxID=156304 RepID=A0AAJ7N7A7_9HYME|nr:protein ALP1-like [Ceratina calcarata]